MYINYFLIAFLVIALVLSVANIYSMLMIKRYLKSEVINKNLDLLRKEMSVLEERQTLHQAQVKANLKNLIALEHIITHILNASAGFGPDDGSDQTRH